MAASVRTVGAEQLRTAWYANWWDTTGVGCEACRCLRKLVLGDNDG